MRAEGRPGRVADRLAPAPEHAGTLTAIRAPVAGPGPDAVEAASRREGSVRWGTGARRTTDGFACAMPHRAHVTPGVREGADLPDPGRRLGGSGKRLRHVRPTRAEEPAGPAIRALSAAAIAARRNRPTGGTTP